MYLGLRMGRFDHGEFGTLRTPIEGLRLQNSGPYFNLGVVRDGTGIKALRRGDQK